MGFFYLLTSGDGSIVPINYRFLPSKLILECQKCHRVADSIWLLRQERYENTSAPAFCVPGGVMRALKGLFTGWYSCDFNGCYDPVVEFIFGLGMDCNNGNLMT